MAIKKYRPLSPDPYVNKIKGDTEFARLAHLNDLANQVEDALGTAIPSQTGNAGEFLTTDGTNASWTSIDASRIPTPQLSNKFPSGAGVLINEVPIGAINDGVLPRTLGGAMTTATISKVGNYDKLAVTGGNQSSFIYFNNVWISDSGSRIKLTVKVENLNKDGVTGTSYLGLMGYGLNFTWDTGSVQNTGAACELISKGMGFYNFSSSYTAADTFSASSGTLVTSGDILDVELQYDPYNAGGRFKVKNRTTGQYISGYKFSVAGVFGYIRTQLIKTGRLGLIASNADYTILDFKVYSSQTNPIAAFVGDNYTVGYNQDYSQFLLPKLTALVPYQFTSYIANGSGINNIFAVQVPEALKLRPRYIFLADLNLMDGRFINTSPDYPVWYDTFTAVINEITAKGSIPVLIKSAPGGIYAANKPAWNTFVDQQVLLFPQIKVLDMTSLPFLWNDNFGLPGGDDMTLMANAVNQFLIAEGY